MCKILRGIFWCMQHPMCLLKLFRLLDSLFLHCYCKNSLLMRVVKLCQISWDYIPASEGTSLCQFLLVCCGCDQAVVVNVDTLLKCLCNLMCICFIYLIFIFFKLWNVLMSVTVYSKCAVYHFLCNNQRSSCFELLNRLYLIACIPLYNFLLVFIFYMCSYEVRPVEPMCNLCFEEKMCSCWH